MAQDIEKLTIALEANIKQFEKSMDDARRKSEQSLGDIEKKANSSVSGVEGQLNKMGDAFRRASSTIMQIGSRLVIPAAAVAGIAALVKEFSDLDEAARRASMSASNLQSIRDLGKTGKLDSSKVDKDIQGLATSVYDEIKAGEGDITALFEANNLKLKDREGVQKSINQLLLDAAKLIENAKNPFDEAAIVKTLGLTEDWVKILRRGPEAVQEIINKFNETNKPLDEMAVKAAQLDQAFNDLWTNFTVMSKAAIVSAIQYMAGLVAQIGDSLSKMRKLSEGERQAAYNRGDLIGAYTGYGRGNDDSEPANEPRELTIKGNKRNKGKPTVIPPKKTGGGGGKSASEEKTAYDREIASIEKKTRALKGEAEAIGKTVFEGAKKEALAKLELAAEQAKIKLSPEQIAHNEKIAEQYAKITERIKDLQLAHSQWIELQNFAGNQMISLFKGAMTGADGLRDAVKKLADSLLDASLQAMVLGKGPLAGLFGTGNASNGGVGGLIGTLFSGLGGGGSLPARADGGPVNAGRPYLIGERGPEIMVPGHSGAVFPIAKGGASAGSNVVNITQAFQVSGAFTSDDAKAMAMQAATRAGAATRQSVLAELNSQRKRA